MSIIKGWQKVSFADYPGFAASVLFTSGCNFHCPYCHNPMLAVNSPHLEDIDESEVLRYLEQRKGKIDAVVITGGEPTLHSGIADIIDKVKAQGYKVKVDTNGLRPDFLKQLNVDYIALDFKSRFDKYSLLTDIDINTVRENILQTLEYLKTSGIDYEVRITLAPGIAEEDEVAAMLEHLHGVKRVYLQRFNSSSTLDPDFGSLTPISNERLKKIAAMFEGLVGSCTIR